MKKQFIKYAIVGCLNTAVHWLVFALFFYLLRTSQSTGNLIGFTMAVVCSFFLNAKVTFEAEACLRGFVSFTLFMAAMSWIIGCFADVLQLPPIITLAAFSSISLLLGFLYSKIIVFK